MTREELVAARKAPWQRLSDLLQRTERARGARALPPGRLSRHQSTAADGHLERVSTPATTVPSSISTSSTSVRFLYLMPASAVAKRIPAISGSSG